MEVQFGLFLDCGFGWWRVKGGRGKKCAHDQSVFFFSWLIMLLC